MNEESLARVSHHGSGYPRLGTTPSLSAPPLLNQEGRCLKCSPPHLRRGGALSDGVVPSRGGGGALLPSVTIRDAIKCTQIRELLFQLRKRVLEHHLMARVLTRSHLLLQVGASQQQRFLFAQRCGPFQGQALLGSFLSVRLRGFHL